MKKSLSAPFALVVKKDTFEKSEKVSSNDKINLTREGAIKFVVDCARKDDLIISTTGKASRELYEYRKQTDGFCNDFLTMVVWGMQLQLQPALK